MAETPQDEPLPLFAPEELAEILTAAGDGFVVRTEMVWADIKAGAPVGDDGKINLIHYAAWLTKTLPRRFEV